MKNKNGRLKYFRTICVSIVIIAGILICTRLKFSNYQEQIPDNKDLAKELLQQDSDYFYQLDNQCAKMSEEQLIRYKSQCEEVLNDIQTRLNSDSLNPEERHETLLSKNTIEQELKLVKKHLQIQNESED